MQIEGDASESPKESYFRKTADSQSVPATSAAPRCAASTPSKNRSPAPADRPFAPVPRPGLRTSAASPDPEMRYPDPDETPGATGAARSGSLPARAPPLQSIPLVPAAGRRPV